MKTTDAPEIQKQNKHERIESSLENLKDAIGRFEEFVDEIEHGCPPGCESCPGEKHRPTFISVLDEAPDKIACEAEEIRRLTSRLRALLLG